MVLRRDSVEALVLTGPVMEGRSRYSLVTDDLTNSTLVIPRGASVKMAVAEWTPPLIMR